MADSASTIARDGHCRLPLAQELYRYDIISPHGTHQNVQDKPALSLHCVGLGLRPASMRMWVYRGQMVPLGKTGSIPVVRRLKLCSSCRSVPGGGGGVAGERWPRVTPASRLPHTAWVSRQGLTGSGK